MILDKRSAIIGWSGFVGSTLLRQHPFDDLYRSSDISEIRGREFDLVVCAGAPAQKWFANANPLADRATIQSLRDQLATIQAKTFVLISTVDVFKDPIGVYEYSPVDLAELHPYGTHRRELEQFVTSTFKKHVIVRLPGLVGPGLRKNVIYDFLNGNQLDKIDSRGIFQFYPMVNLWSDLQKAIDANLGLVHLTAASLSVEEVAAHAFGYQFRNLCSSQPSVYDVRSEHARIFGGTGDYQYSARESLIAIRAYAQSEQQTAVSD